MAAHTLIALAALVLSAAAAEPPQVLTRAPGLQLEWTLPAGPLRLRLAAGDSAEVALPPEESRYGQTGHSFLKEDLPLPFVSPDGKWIFVPTRFYANIGGPRLERYEAPAILLRREGARTTPALAERFERAARTFIAHDLGLTETPPEAGPLQRSYEMEFGGWSPDSARLLVRLTSDLFDTAKDERLESAHTHYCYYNLVRGEFEMTERLRAGNLRTEEAWKKLAGNDMFRQYVLGAEALGQEGPEEPPETRLARADKQLNQLYQQLMSKLPTPAGWALRAEERRWLLERDTFAAIYVSQAWTGGSARSVEGQAIATEKRVAELRKRLEP